MKTRTIEVKQLARVEGESSLKIVIEQDSVRDVQLAIFEPPRYFEAMLQGRSYHEAPDITARICGICPVAYQMTAVHALEAAAGITLPASISALRRLLYCGEWIESHALHMHMLHAPDFFGEADAIELAKLAPDAVRRGLSIKKTGNAIVALIGGREIHPINVKVGGFYKTPDSAAMIDLLPELHRGLNAAVAAVEWVTGFSFPDYKTDATLVALQHATQYPMNEGVIASTDGLSIAMEAFNAHIEEHQVPYSNALQSMLETDRPYLTGPLARMALNYERLTPLCHELARAADIEGGTRNPYKSIIVRGLEVVYAYEEAVRIVETLVQPTQASVPVELGHTSAFWATEAPRGLLFHYYVVNHEGTITHAQLVPPTSQNQVTIEHDLMKIISAHLEEPDHQLARRCEDAVRNHDPCISCATHFLEVDIKRQ